MRLAEQKRRKKQLELHFLSNRFYDDAVALKNGKNDARRSPNWRGIVRGAGERAGLSQRQISELIRIFAEGMSAKSRI
jgi:hypothetical protein